MNRFRRFAGVLVFLVLLLSIVGGAEECKTCTLRYVPYLVKVANGRATHMEMTLEHCEDGKWEEVVPGLEAEFFESLEAAGYQNECTSIVVPTPDGLKLSHVLSDEFNEDGSNVVRWEAVSTLIVREVDELPENQPDCVWFILVSAKRAGPEITGYERQLYHRKGGEWVPIPGIWSETMWQQPD